MAAPELPQEGKSRHQQKVRMRRGRQASATDTWPHVPPGRMFITECVGGRQGAAGFPQQHGPLPSTAPGPSAQGCRESRRAGTGTQDRQARPRGPPEAAFHSTGCRAGAYQSWLSQTSSAVGGAAFLVALAVPSLVALAASSPPPHQASQPSPLSLFLLLDAEPEPHTSQLSELLLSAEASAHVQLSLLGDRCALAGSAVPKASQKL